MEHHRTFYLLTYLLTAAMLTTTPHELFWVGSLSYDELHVQEQCAVNTEYRRKLMSTETNASLKTNWDHYSNTDRQSAVSSHKAYA